MNDLTQLEKKLQWLLQGWQASAVEADEVHYLAEKWLSEQEWFDLPREDRRSVVLEVLAQLDILNQQLIIQDDVPALLRFMEQGKQDAPRAWRSWEQYWEGVDLEARQAMLSGDPAYAC